MIEAEPNVWLLRQRLFLYLVHNCHLSPKEIDAIGYFDLIGLAIQYDTEVAENKKRRLEAERSRNAHH